MASSSLKSTEGTSCQNTVCDTCADNTIENLTCTGGADVNGLWKDEESMLMRAVRKGHDKCVEAVIRSGADVNMKDKDGLTALMSTAAQEEIICTEILIAAGADVNCKNNYGQTALLFALYYGCGTYVKSFLGIGVDLNVQDNGGKAFPITVAFRKLEHCIELLIQAGADVNIQDNRGLGALHYGASYIRPRCFKGFIRAGANVNLADSNGTTAMHMLLQERQRCPSTITYVKRFLAAGANVNMANNVGTFIDIFSSSYQIDQCEAKFIKLLFAAGDKITKPSDEVKRILNEAGEMNLSHLCREANSKHLLDLDPHENLFGRVPRLRLPAALQSFLLYDQTLDEADDDDDDGDGQTITSILDLIL